MTEQKLTEGEKFHIKTQEDTSLFNRIFTIIDDIEKRLKTLETKNK
tara:strand:- start:1010 stop:1147 length:138 start_codon:yes stop_codon:yes gene_type:complete